MACLRPTGVEGCYKYFLFDIGVPQKRQARSGLGKVEASIAAPQQQCGQRRPATNPIPLKQGTSLQPLQTSFPTITFQVSIPFQQGTSLQLGATDNYRIRYISQSLFSREPHCNLIYSGAVATSNLSQSLFSREPHCNSCGTSCAAGRTGLNPFSAGNLIATLPKSVHALAEQVSIPFQQGTSLQLPPLRGAAGGLLQARLRGPLRRSAVGDLDLASLLPLSPKNASIPHRANFPGATRPLAVLARPCCGARRLLALVP